MFGKSIVALVTPFTEENQIDTKALEELISWQIEEGTEGLVLCGSTGEGSALTFDEKCHIFETAFKIGKKTISLIANTGTNLTEESVRLTTVAKQIGMDGCLAIVPYYNKPGPEGCFQHFAHITEVGLPTIIYHHPGRTGTKLSLETLSRVCQLTHVVGIKDATGDLSLAMEIMHKIDIPLYSGDDLLALPQFTIGFTGSISVVGNVIPSQWKDFVCHPSKSKFEGLYDIVQSMALEVNPQCVKYAVSLLGKCSSKMRLPLIEPDKKNCQKISASLKGLGEALESAFFVP